MNKSDLSRDYFMLKGPLGRQGYDWWWHSFTGISEKTGEEKSFFIEFFTCNPQLAEKEPVLGQLPENRMAGKKPSYVMVKAGWWGKDATQLHRFFPWKTGIIENSPSFTIQVDDCWLSEHHTRGSVSVSRTQAEQVAYMSDSGSMEWDLMIHKQVAFHVGYGAGRLFRGLNAFEMYWHAQGMKTRYEGTITANGEKFVVKPDCSYGYADKNWGSDFTSPWVWLSSNDLYSRKYQKQLKNSVFDIGGGRPKVFGIPLNRKLLGAFYYEGRNFEFNFSKFWTHAKTEFQCKETNELLIWKVRMETDKALMKLEIHCRKEQMLLVNYEAPDGTKRYDRLWNGGTGTGRIKLYEKRDGKLHLIDDMDVRHTGCEFGEYAQAHE